MKLFLHHAYSKIITKTCIFFYIQALFNISLEEGFPKKWIVRSIVTIYKIGNKCNPSDYRIIMISLLLATLYCIFIENKSSICLDDNNLRAKR